MPERSAEYGAHRLKDLPLGEGTTSLLLDHQYQFDIIPFLEKHADELRGHSLWGVIYGSAFDDEDRRVVTGYIMCPLGTLQREGGALQQAARYQEQIRFEDATLKEGYTCRWYSVLLDPQLNTEHPFWKRPTWEKFPGIR